MPVIALALKFNVVILRSAPMLLGMEPDKLLFSTYRYISDVRLPMDSGSVDDRALWSSIMRVRVVNCPNDSGRGPAKELPGIVSCTIELLTQCVFSKVQ